ncbi:MULTISPECIES: thermonuclease family protein [unclassified Rhizobium]|uniref:thermonuclease family protein n=1 Tax=unclassified Rhizobium TaxID=2613769 RepID=UPI001FCCF58E|nr:MULTISPECIES: thermonuclease family protein [unclassified Rhizobium]
MAVTGRRLRDALVGAGMLFLALLIIAKLENAQAIRTRGPFVVVDGDTLTEEGRRLRINGIDAPELGQMCDRPSGSYDCGMAARAGLVLLLKGAPVECSGQEDDEDRYGRLLVTCLKGAVDLGHEMVAAGLAVANGDYHMAELRARKAGYGIWAGSFERPEDWRRLQRLEAREPGGWSQTLTFDALGRWFRGSD